MARPIQYGLTPARERIARLIHQLELGSEPPFVNVLVRELRLAGESSLTRTLQRMQASDLLRIHVGGRGRSNIVHLTAKGRASIGVNGLPVLGTIPAGPISEAVQFFGEFFTDNELLPSRPGDFLLRVSGDSMIDCGILPGDLVLLRPHIKVESGEIVAALVGSDYEATLKKVIFDKPKAGLLTLEAGNEEYQPRIEFVENVTFSGVFRGLVRRPKKSN